MRKADGFNVTNLWTEVEPGFIQWWKCSGPCREVEERDGVWVTSMCWEWNFDYKCSGCQLNVFSIVECCMFTMIWFIIICGKCSIIFYQLWLLTLSSVIVDGKKILMTLEDFKTFVACHSCVAQDWLLKDYFW